MNIWSDSMEFVKSLVCNLYLCWGIIALLLVSNIILIITCSNLKKRKKIKDDFIEIERQVNIEKIEEKKEEKSNELTSILDKMQKDIEVRPEQVVANFEAEQEKNAIISYQELVDCVKNNKIQVMDDEDCEVNFVNELEKEINQEPIVNIKQKSEQTHLDLIDEINDNKKFTSSEFISPVYGRMNSYNQVSNPNSLKLGENTMDLEPVANEIKKNEDFLKNLVDFRNNL